MKITKQEMSKTNQVLVHIKKDSLICLGSDPVSTISIITGIIIFLLGITIFLIDPVLLKKGILQLAQLYSVDGKIEEDTIFYLNTMLMKIAPLVMISSFIIFLYGFTWQYFSVRLKHIKALEPQSLYNCPILPFEVYYLVSILILAIVLRLHNINRGLEYDELATAYYFVDTKSFWTTISTCILYNNHIMNSILSRISQMLFGHYEWALRLPAFLLGLASIYVMWIFARSLLGKISAIIAAFFLAISPIHVNYSATARGYTGVILFSILSTYYFIKLLHQHSHRFTFIYILVNVCAIYFHLYAVFTISVQILWLLYSVFKQPTKPAIIIDKRTFQTLWMSFAMVILLSILLYSPILPVILFNIFIEGRGHTQPFFIVTLVKYLSSTSSALPEMLTHVLIILGMVYFYRSWPQLLNYFLALVLFPALLVSLILCPNNISPRFFLYYLPYYILILSAGFLYLRKIYGELNWPIFIKKSYLSIVVLFFIALTWHWLAISWTLPRDEGIRSAVKSMEQSNLETTSLCAIGIGYELYRYYTNKEIQMPDSYESFNELKSKKTEILCVCNTSLTILPKHKEILEFLQNHTSSKRFGNCVVFHYRSDKML